MIPIDGWFAMQSQVHGGGSIDFYWTYNWDGTTHATRNLAISHGFTRFECDDFNVGQIEGGKLVWFGWMDKPLLEDIASTAVELGLSA